MPNLAQPLSDGVVSLRPYQLEDLEETFQSVRESLDALQPWMSWAHKDYSAAETLAWLQKVIASWQADEEYAFAITDSIDGSYIGGCGLNQINQAHQLCNLGYWVRSSRRGHGYAVRAARLAAEFGLKTLGLLRMEIVVGVDNAASLRVAQKAGALREGILRDRMTIAGKPAEAVMHSLVRADFPP